MPLFINCLVAIFLGVAGCMISFSVTAAHPVPGEKWPSADPGDWNKDLLDSARLTFDDLDSSALMVIHQGNLIVDWGATDQKVNVASVRKSLLNGLFGIAWDAGIIDLNSTLAELNINDTDPVLTPSERTATIEHLLLSRSGVFHPALYDAGWYKNMPDRGTHDPGKFWIYNNWDFNTLGSIFEQSTNRTIHDAFNEYFAEALQMQDFDLEDVSYETRDNLSERFRGNTSDHRLYLFKISPRDLARFGLLYLNKGKWGDQRVLSEAWIEKSTKGLETNFESRRFLTRYGYLWWIDKGEQRRFKLKNETSKIIFATGARGHYLMIAPDYELVIVHGTSTPRGASSWDQIARRFFGAPNVQDWQFTGLLEQLMAAHPAKTSLE